MVAPAFGCNQDRLLRLLDDDLTGEQQAEVVKHLDACPECQKSLELLAAEHVWWERLRDLPVASPVRDTDKSSEATIAARDRANAADDGIPLDFLDIAENPEHLGRLGPFAVTEVLGRGGMGVVLKAIDAALSRPVAIKVLAPHFASSGAARKRFAREAQAAAAVVHDHVVAIYSVGEWKGLPYLVMSYVPGRSLQDLLDAEGPLDVKVTLRIGMQTALGLAAAHAQGLVHRDVKPANILLENDVKRVRITDFGLARTMDDASLTQSGVIAGTPQYMSPEQTRSEVVDHRSDLFSRGSTLYAMCTGNAPFRADSPMTVLLRIRDERPRPIRAITPDVPVWLEALVDKLHAKTADERFQTAAEVADLLEKCLAHMQQPVSNPLPPALADLTVGRFWRKCRRALAAAGLSMLILATTISWHHFMGVPPDGAKDSQANTVQLDRESFWIPMDDVRRQAERLDAELHQPVPTNATNDIGAALLNQAHKDLGKLERELAPLRLAPTEK